MKLSTILTYLMSLLFLSLILNACVHDPIFIDDPVKKDTTKQDTTKQDTTVKQPRKCDPDTVYFESEILPLLQSGCAKSGCHDASSRREGVVMDGYKNIINTGRVSPGNASRSKLYTVLISSGERMMPPYSGGGPFTQDQIDLVKKWIDQGAKNNKCVQSSCDTAQVTFSASVQPILKTYCQGCHNNNLPSGNVNLQGYTNVKTAVDRGRLMGSIRHKNGYSAMPQGGAKLDDCSLRKIAIWIKDGANNN
ncbi:hypothetical protein GC194_13890 [bacterium]|nr:hypothetical protein [bacterium]